VPSDSLFTKCNKCGKAVSKSASACNHCGTRRSRLSTIHWIGIAFFGLIFFGVFTVPDKSNAPSTSPPTKSSSASNAGEKPDADKVFKEGETVHVGYVSYVVWRSWWTFSLGDNEYLHETPDAMFLVVELAVRNDDSESRIIPNFELTDERGATYESSSKAWAIDNSIGILDSLNPGVDKTGLIVFDVPQKDGYRLKASGGFWSKEKVFIELAPRQRGVK